MVSLLCQIRVVVLGGALAVLSGCGGAKRPPSVGSPGVPFRSKSRQDKTAFMAAQVKPVMGHLFQKWNPKSYEKFDCDTCHGADMDKVDFHMPNSLYALPAENTIAEAKDYDEKTTEFMMNEVVPTFARLLHEKPGDPAGVTCFTCHPKE